MIYSLDLSAMDGVTLVVNGELTPFNDVYRKLRDVGIEEIPEFSFSGRNATKEGPFVAAV